MRDAAEAVEAWISFIHLSALYYLRHMWDFDSTWRHDGSHH